MNVYYTCIVAGRDRVKALPVRTPGWRHVLFTDDRTLLDHGHVDWEVRPAACAYDDPVRTARWHKHHPFELFPAATLTVWADATHWPKRPLDWAEGMAPFATFRHPTRTRLKQEVDEVCRLRLDDPAIVGAQWSRYVAEGFVDESGAFGTACLVRRRTDGTARLQEAWWAEIAAGSRRDQISLPYVAWRHPEVPVAAIPGEPRWRNDYLDFDLTGHGPGIYKA